MSTLSINNSPEESACCRLTPAIAKKTRGLIRPVLRVLRVGAFDLQREHRWYRRCQRARLCSITHERSCRVPKTAQDTEAPLFFSFPLFHSSAPCGGNRCSQSPRHCNRSHCAHGVTISRTLRYHRDN
ncbi:hypothetical protein F2P81_009258 [Scophthalmus maximus]|uniref:Uncharacterized protein n=1 Tax=Scophthalmus maximus TaxID=52904 RepID=A0A6A4T6J0_SCOMX|nr:hypothetical protein F2P81_026346 [Scophthalmus maximus]KAF0038774.1 hypothetical protein F2P81_009258 [Scophthalmus maximus]